MMTIKFAGHPFRIYKGEEAGIPEAHEATKYYYEPIDWDTNDVYSAGFTSQEEAILSLRAMVSSNPDLFELGNSIEMVSSNPEEWYGDGNGFFW